jgi:hypothetical protein
MYCQDLRNIILKAPSYANGDACMILWRGSDSMYELKMDYSLNLHNEHMIVHSGFYSTSLDLQAAEEFVNGKGKKCCMKRIVLSYAVPCLLMNSFSYFGNNESEVLFWS